MASMFSSKSINQILENVKKREEELGSFFDKEPMPMGQNKVILSDVTLEHSKKDQNAMIRMTFDHFTEPEKYRSIIENFMLEGTTQSVEINKQRLVEFLYKAFDYAIQPCNTVEDVLKQVQTFKGKPLKIAVKYSQSLYNTKKEGQDVVMIVEKPEYWYAGKADEDLYVNVSKALKELSDKDKERVVQMKELDPDLKIINNTTQGKEPDLFSETKTTEKEKGKKLRSDEIKFPEKNKTAGNTAAVQQEADDDLPF